MKINPIVGTVDDGTGTPEAELITVLTDQDGYVSVTALGVVIVVDRRELLAALEANAGDNVGSAPRLEEAA